MRLGREVGATTLLNPAPAADLSNEDLSSVDYLLPNEHEVHVCAGISSEAPLEEAVQKLLARGCRNVLVTLGDSGCLLCASDGSRQEVPGFAVHAVDTVGAGDAFCGALATVLLEACPLIQALRFAHAAAALSVTKPDTVPSYHHRSAVEELLSS